MKKILILLFSLVFAFSVVSCGNGSDEMTQETSSQKTEKIINEDKEAQNAISEAVFKAYCGNGNPDGKGFFSPASIKISSLEITNISGIYEAGTDQNGSRPQICDVQIQATAKINEEVNTVTKNILVCTQGGYLDEGTPDASEGTYRLLYENEAESSGTDSWSNVVEDLKSGMSSGSYSLLVSGSNLSKKAICESLKAKITDYHEKLKSGEISNESVNSDSPSETPASLTPIPALTSSDALYYYGQTIGMLKNGMGAPDTDPAFHPLSWCESPKSNTYQYSNGKKLFAYVDHASNDDSKIICVSVTGDASLAPDIAAGMTYNKLSEYFRFETDSPVDNDTHTASVSWTTININGSDAMIYVEYPNGADKETPCAKISVYDSTGKLIEEEYKKQQANAAAAVTTAAASKIGYVRVNDPTSYLNLRSGPGTNYTSVAKLYMDEQVIIKETNNGWYYVETSKGIGYVSSDYIRLQ